LRIETDRSAPPGEDCRSPSVADGASLHFPHGISTIVGHPSQANHRVKILAALCLLASAARAALPLPDADDGAIRLPPGFRALVVADNLVAGRQLRGTPENLRFLSIAPNGDIYGKLYRNGIVALRDTKGDGRADMIREFGSGPGTGISVRDGWLYYSTRTGVYRYRYVPGQLIPMGEAEVIVSGLPAGPQHDAKSFAFDDEGRILVETGSPFNVYSEGDRQFGAKGIDPTDFLKTHGGFWRYDPNRLNQTQEDGFHYSTGHRHSLALAWNPVSHAFFMVMMGRDNMNLVDPKDYSDFDNAGRVAEELHQLHEGADLGWPYTYYDPLRQARMVAPEFGGDNRTQAPPGKYDAPLIAFPAHWAPLQMTFYSGTQFPQKYRGGAFIAFHGSWNRAPLPQGGYNVVFVPFDDRGNAKGNFEIFADGFAGTRGPFTHVADARFRPGAVAVGPDGSLYVGDTEKGRIWRIIYTGESRPGAEAVNPVPPDDSVPAAAIAGGAGAVLADASAGAPYYRQVCAACHMSDGSGVPNMQPSLKGDAIVAGDTARLIDVILRGPAAALPADRPHFQNVMPPFGGLDDATVASVVSYVRQTFGGGASAVTAGDVAARRGGTSSSGAPAPAAAASSMAASPSEATRPQILLESGDLRLVFLGGRVRLERSGALLAEVRSFEFNFAAPKSITAATVTDAGAVLHAVYPASANYRDESHDWEVDIDVIKSPGGFRFKATPPWAANTTVRLSDLGDHYFGILERLFPNNRRSPDLRGQVVEVEARGSGSQYGENWASVFSAFYMTAHGYASFFDTFADGSYRLGIDGETELYHHTGALDWFLFAGQNGDEILASYYRVIGAPKAPPLWSLGPIGWRDFNRGGAPEVLADVQHMTDLHIPFTGWWVDRPYSNGANGWSKMDFSPDFANPGEWIGKLQHEYGLHVMTWVGPMVFEDTDFPGILPGPHGYFDLSNPAAVKEFGERLAAKQYAYGIQGHKMDRADEYFPDTAPWVDKTDIFTTRNKYLFLYSKVVNDALVKAWGPDQFNFARSAFHRSQRFLSAVWGGDVRSSWDGMASNLANSLRVGFMGFPMWGSDTGGYLGGRIDEELYSRWLEFGAWSGLFEIKLDDLNGNGADRPPWVYGPHLQAVFRDACNQRMQLLPYLYSIARSSARHGVMMKPLAYVWPKDELTYGIGDEYLFGPAFLVAPIIEPGGQRSVYLPAGTWYDYYDPQKRYAGGQSISVSVPIEHNPVFVRGNSVYVTGSVPIGNGKAWAGNSEPGLTVNGTPGETGDYTSFEFVDSFDHDLSKTIGLERSADAVVLTAPPLGAPAEVRIRCDGASAVTLGGHGVPVAYDGALHAVHLHIPAGEPIQIRLTTGPSTVP